MILLLAKIGNTLLLMMAVAWYCNNREWEPLIFVCATFGTLVSLFVTSYISEKKGSKNESSLSDFDIELLRKFKALIPPNGNTMLFLRDYDVATAFHESMTDPFVEYVDSWKGPAYRFLNRSLEKKRKELDKEIRQYAELLFQHTFTHKTRFDHKIFPMKEFEYDAQKESIRKELNDKGTKLSASIEDFYQKAFELNNKAI